MDPRLSTTLIPPIRLIPYLIITKQFLLNNNVTYHPSVSDPDAMEVDNLNIEGQRISSTRRKTSKETRTCYQCGMKGHLKKNCRRKARSSRFRKSVRQNVLSIEETEPMDEDDEEQKHF